MAAGAVSRLRFVLAMLSAALVVLCLSPLAHAQKAKASKKFRGAPAGVEYKVGTHEPPAGEGG